MKLYTATASQNINLTLNESTPDTSLGWILEFENVSTNATYSCLAKTAINNDRYNRITVDTNNKDFADGGVNITQIGYYILRVYWRIDETTPNSDRLVETKLVRFVKPVETSHIIHADNHNEQVIYYES